MPVYQAFNSKIGAWVKYKFAPGVGFKALDVKQKEPRVPFKGITKRGNTKRRIEWNSIQ